MKKVRFLLCVVASMACSVCAAANFDESLRTEENGFSYYQGAALFYGIATYAPDRYSLGNDYSAGVENFYFEYVRASSGSSLADYVASNSDAFQVVGGTNRAAFVDTSRTINGKSSTRNFFAFTLNEDGTVEPLVDYIKVRKDGNYYKAFLSQEVVDQSIFAPDALSLIEVDAISFGQSVAAVILHWVALGLAVAVFLFCFFYCASMILGARGVKFVTPEQRAVDRELIKRGSMPQYDQTLIDAVEDNEARGKRELYELGRRYVEEDFEKDMKLVYRDRRGKRRTAKQVAKQIEFLRLEKERNLKRFDRLENDIEDDIDVDEEVEEVDA